MIWEESSSQGRSGENLISGKARPWKFLRTVRAGLSCRNVNPRRNKMMRCNFIFGGRRKPVKHSKKKEMDSGKKVGLYKGHIFWSGSVRLSDGRIQEIHSFREAQETDFHAMFYFSPEQISKMDSGECAFFWVTEEGKVELDDEVDFGQAYIISQIKKQITITAEGRAKKAVIAMKRKGRKGKPKTYFPRGGKKRGNC